MKLARHDLVAALSLRYDHYSSQSLFEAACKRANLTDQEDYSVAEVAAFRAALATLGDRLQRVDDRLDSLLGTSEPAAKPAAATAKSVPGGSDGGSKTEAPKSTAPAPAKPAHVATPAQSDPAAKAPHAAAPTPAPSPSPEAAETRIVLTGIELADGDGLFVCGDRAELGNWDPERARPMMRDGDAWIAVVPRGEGVFKFLRRTEDGAVTWEPGDNREIGMAAKIETSWQAQGSD